MSNDARVSFSLTEFILKTKPKKRSFGIPKSSRVKAREDIKLMSETGDWTAATGVHFVALYEWFFEKVYGFYPATLTDSSREWAIAAKSANELIDKELKGNKDEAVAFINWVWVEHRKQLEWANSKSIVLTPLSAYAQFGGKWVDKYRAYRLTVKK